MKNKKLFFIIGIILILVGVLFISIFLKNKNSNGIVDSLNSEENRAEKIKENTDGSIVNSNQDGVYSIKNQSFYLYEDNENNISEEYRGMKLLEYDNSNKNYAEIYYILYDYTTEPSVSYFLTIQDEDSNSLILDNADEAQIIGGMISHIKIKKVDLNTKINIAIFEKYDEEKKIANSSEIEIDLTKDIEPKEEIDQSEKLTEALLGNVKFKYIDSENLYHGTTEHAYSKKLVGENYSIPINVQYGNYLMPEEHIDFWCEKNVNHLSLDEAFSSLVIITENFGQYGLSDVYSLSITNSDGEVIQEVIVDFDELIKLCKGQSIEKEGIKYTKDSFEGFAELEYKKEKDMKIGNGINAIKYYYESDNAYDYYMFLEEDNIYYITVPTKERISKEVKEFLDNLEV